MTAAGRRYVLAALPRPDLPDGPTRALFDQLHELHHRAGWPSLRDMAREVGCSHTTISAAFSEPRIPRWGLLELIVETLGGDTAWFHQLWLAASRPAENLDAPTPSRPAPAPPALPAPPRELPADVVAFTGRAGAVADLDALLARAAGAPALTIAAISGTAGVGKTALAVHWAHRVADRFPDGQLYVDLRGYGPEPPVRAAQALETFLRVLGVSGPDIPHNLPERAARYRTLLAGRRVLVLLDNAHSVEQVRDLLPGSPSCFVVVTSRDTLPALVARHGATRTNLDLLASTEAHALLRTLVGSRVQADPAAADLLAARCARLPLALRIAAELAVARPRTALADLVRELDDEPRRLDLLAAGDDDHTAVRAVFSWSLRHLTVPSALAFTLLGLHPGADLDRRAVAALTGTDPATARGLIDSLLRAHLLDEVGGGRLGRHDLLHAYAAEQAARLDERVRRAARERLLSYYLATAGSAVQVAFPGATTPADDATAPVGFGSAAAAAFGTAAAAMAWLDAERSNLLTLARIDAEGSGSFSSALSATLAPYLDARAHYHDAVVLHGLARAAAHADGDLRAEGRAHARLSTVHRRLGDYREAITHGERALAVQREIDDRPSLGATLHQLGVAYWRLGRYADAVHRIEEALTHFRSYGDHGGQAAAAYGLGIAQFQLNDYPAAQAYHERALEIFRRIGDRTGEGRTHNNIGLVAQRLGRPERARQHYGRALRIAREVGNRTGEAVALINLADLDVEAGDPAQARQRYDTALVLSRHSGYRVGQADALRGLGVVLGQLGRVTDSIDHLVNAVDLCRELGEHETQVRALLDLGDAVRRAGQPDEAAVHYRAALDRSTESGDRHAQRRAREALAALPEPAAPPGGGDPPRTPVVRVPAEDAEVT
ncbi:ATP-binding protein [Micromonospora radicis]|uniref:AfsR family transcriptional regulator n=1 Tax=Micromonospora radicis TaxID=1894971 RepID=A0A418MXW3_9ACTN|nr:tetratricopeptide repeat protein [Micromonospora radicis]RIV39745.1 AfsR family transcriptional regulator [Micromonospora radicis]